MSIAVRLWTDAELEATKTDKWLATLLMNATTFNQRMIQALNTLPRKYHKRYLCEWAGEDEDSEPIEIEATDEKMLARFLDAEYTKRPDLICQVITQYRPVNL